MVGASLVPALKGNRKGYPYSPIETDWATAFPNHRASTLVEDDPHGAPL